MIEINFEENDDLENQYRSLFDEKTNVKAFLKEIND